MKWRFPTTGLVLILWAICSGCLEAQVHETQAQLDLTVEDESGAAVADVEMRIRRHGDPLPRPFEKATPYGTFSLNLQPGTYEVFVTSPDFAPFAEKVELRAGISESRKIALELADGNTIVRMGNHESIRTDAPVAIPELVEFVAIDNQGRPVGGAQILRATADEHGKATLPLTPDTYDIVVTSPGYRRWNQNIDVKRGNPQAISIVLEEMPVAD
jgi:hypothetical protein